jgi:AbrB family looped-hinge helix DNA binding protein
MAVYEARVFGKGRVTVPVEVRRKLGIAGAGTLTFCVSEEGNVVVYKKDNIPPDPKGTIVRPSKDTA